MRNMVLSRVLAEKTADLYARMEAAYDSVAAALDFSCMGCPDNCCDSYFLHHTYLEWLYLWEGLSRLDPQRRQAIIDRARQYMDGAGRQLAAGKKPLIMCPLNEDGLCGLYAHRLMICRMHGVPSRFSLPDGSSKEFLGCFRCQELVADRPQVPQVDRTPLYAELADLERQVRLAAGRPLPRIKMTIAAMIVQGPPEMP